MTDPEDAAQFHVGDGRSDNSDERTPLDGKAGLISRLLWALAPRACQRRVHRRAKKAAKAGDSVSAVRWLRELAVLGDAEAQYQLGKHYAEGRGLVRNLPDAVVWMRRAARQGHSGAQGFIGQVCTLGSARMRQSWDPERWYRPDADVPPNADNRGLFFPAGVAVPVDKDAAFAWYYEASKSGHPLGQVQVAKRLIRGEDIEKDEARALELLRQSAEHDCREAHFELARAYRYGTLVPADISLAVEHYRKAANADHMEAIFELAYLLISDQSVLDHKEAAKWFARGAERNHVHSQLGLASLYHHGHGIPQNISMAIMWYRRAARGGHPSAQFNLGRFYEFGRGVEKDTFEAAEWYQKAVLKGHVQAMFNLGSLYARGEGVVRNIDVAVALFIQAAERGHIEARVNLGLLNSQNRMNGANPVEAVKWFVAARAIARSEQINHIDRYMAELSSRLPPEEIERGRTLAQDWMSQYPPPGP